jgi:hypothetical protein
MKKLILPILFWLFTTLVVLLLSLETFAQTTAYSTFYVCSQEYAILNKEKNVYEIQNTYTCNDCKIMINDYYIRVFEDGKETITIDKTQYYKSSEKGNTAFFRNKYSTSFMHMDKNSRWIGFGKDDYKFIYNFCLGN